ncbi:hypothetical protein ACQEU6_02090 [Spirillospora sp. CA-108201]
MRMLEIVEALERRFGVEFAPTALLPERLHRMNDLCALIYVFGVQFNPESQ